MSTDTSTLPQRVVKSSAGETDEPSANAAPATRTRKPFGRAQAKLAYPDREGYVRRWFNDTPGRIQRAKDAGYEHVVDPRTKNPVTLVVGVAERGGGLSAFLMEIPREFYEEDFAAKQEALDEIDKAVQRGNWKEEPGDKRYVPAATPINFSRRPNLR
jgi:hypothetical protein